MSSSSPTVLGEQYSRSFRSAWLDIVEGIQQYQLWVFLGLQDIKQRYRRSTLGPIWITIATGVLAISLGTLYGVLFGMHWQTFLPHVTIGFIAWGFISNCFKEGTTVFVDNEGLIKQLPAPLSIHIYRLLWRNILFLLHNLIIWLLMISIVGIPVTLNTLLFVPAFFIVSIISASAAMVFGIASSRFRDLPPLVDTLMQLSFYVTPIVWTADTLAAQSNDRAKWITLLELNPFYHLVEIIRQPLLGQAIAADHWIGSGLIMVLSFSLAILTMKYWRSRISYWV